jgi:DNA replication protein DnaC
MNPTTLLAPPVPPAARPSGGPPLEVDRTREQLQQLGLVHAAEALAEELSEAVKHDRPPHLVLERLLSHEVNARDERRVRTSLTLSNLPPGLTLGNFDFSFQPSIERRQVETLATCAFVREHCTLLVQGPPGVGAIEQGFSVAFYRLEDLLHEMRKDAAVSPQALRRKKYFNVAYLVVDEVGMEPMGREDASLFFRLVSYRSGRGPHIRSRRTSRSRTGRESWPGTRP